MNFTKGELMSNRRALIRGVDVGGQGEGPEKRSNFSQKSSEKLPFQSKVFDLFRNFLTKTLVLKNFQFKAPREASEFIKVLEEKLMEPFIL